MLIKHFFSWLGFGLKFATVDMKARHRADDVERKENEKNFDLGLGFRLKLANIDVTALL